MPSSQIPAGPKGFLDSDGEKIYFESWGSGETVVLSHGMGGNHAIWYQQVPALATRYRVVTWDQRGFGRSTAATGHIGPEPSIRDLGRLLDRLEAERAHLIGQSMGGWPSLGFALAHPERTISLTLADTIAGIFNPRIKQALIDYAQVIATSPPPDQLPLGAHPAIGDQLADEDIAQAFLYGQIGALAPGPSRTAISELLVATDHTEHLHRLDAPTLFIVGENDPIFTVDLIEEARELVPGSEISVIPDSGHSPYFERPGAWNDVVLEFLQRFAGKED